MNIEKKEFENYISTLFEGIDKPLYGTIELTNHCPYNCLHYFESDDRSHDFWKKDKIFNLIPVLHKKTC